MIRSIIPNKPGVIRRSIMHKRIAGNHRNYWIVVILAMIAAITNATTTLAHGVVIDYNVNVGVEIIAAFDSGEIMDQAQVSIFAPNDLANPWLVGTTDDQGRFFFTPDPKIAGTWDVQVRKAGHGEIIHIPIEGGTVLTNSSGFTGMQIFIMSASVIWGLIGTALYFSGRKN